MADSCSFLFASIEVYRLSVYCWYNFSIILMVYHKHLEIEYTPEQALHHTTDWAPKLGEGTSNYPQWHHCGRGNSDIMQVVIDMSIIVSYWPLAFPGDGSVNLWMNVNILNCFQFHIQPHLSVLVSGFSKALHDIMEGCLKSSATSNWCEQGGCAAFILRGTGFNCTSMLGAYCTDPQLTIWLDSGCLDRL